MEAAGGQLEPEERFPLHFLIWEGNLRGVQAHMELKEKEDLEILDPRGRTPLHLAVSLGHFEIARLLLRSGSNANVENAKFWSVLHEGTCTGDPELVQLILQYRDFQRLMHRTDGIPALLQKLREAPDFYVEMKWEFTSWVPLVSRMCPSDTYKVYKSGSMVRIDTTLLGFDNTRWERGSRSYVFKGDVDSAKVMEIDHDSQVVYMETVKGFREPPSLDLLLPSPEQVSARLTSPVVTTFLDTERIEFERAKSGVWGFRSDKVDVINGYECKVFSASNVQFVTKTRSEHLSDQDKKAMKKNRSSLSHLESFLGLAEKHTEKPAPLESDIVDIHNPSSITAEEYFNEHFDLEGRDIGRPREMTTKIQKFKAHLSLCEEYPLALQEQVMPIIDLMAASNAHFRKLKDFITLQLPAGFPVKIEIPIFHILNAKITFGNIFSLDHPVDLVNVINDDTMAGCAVDEQAFEPPSTYKVIGGGSHQEERYVDQDDQLLQFAIQQSLGEAPEQSGGERLTLQEALATFRSQNPNSSNLPQGSYDARMQLAVALSQESSTSTQDEIAKQEEDELQRILALSLVEK